jgi:hypothetical protein
MTKALKLYQKIVREELILLLIFFLFPKLTHSLRKYVVLAFPSVKSR